MILDETLDTRNGKYIISYVNERGSKDFLEFNTTKFKTYYKTPTGRFDTWDECKCDIKYTDRPSLFDLLEFKEELDSKYKDKLSLKTMPKLYSWDIEIDYDPEIKMDVESANDEITTISICSPDMNTIVLGTRDLSEEQQNTISKKYKEYLSRIQFYKDNHYDGYFKYYKFESELKMLEYFLKNIVAKVPILAGWNTDGFDTQYVQNRIKNHYPTLSFRSGSCKYGLKNTNVVNLNGTKIKFQKPTHTLMLDSMDYIHNMDKVVLPIKESQALDWYADAALGARKVKYKGNLATLLHDDYETYVLYNAIDSALVELLNYKFKTLDIVCKFANITKLPIGDCFGKVKLTASLFWQDFYERGMKVPGEEKRDMDERGELVGAYVKEPTPGKYNWVTCHDFSGLYPSQIITCNISPESVVRPSKGYWTREELDWYRANPKYFVSINNNVYKNDKDYTFKRVQIRLKDNRSITKYRSKALEAELLNPMDKATANGIDMSKLKPFSEITKEFIKKTWGYNSIEDVFNDTKENRDELYIKVKQEITDEILDEQAFKLLGNSAYGGSSHPAFFWYSMEVASDITGESRNLTHMMEHETNTFYREKFINRKDIHDTLGVEFNKEKYNKKVISGWLPTKYADTDSCYIELAPVIDSIIGVESWNDRQKTNFLARLSTQIMNDYYNNYLTEYFAKRHVKSVHFFELETIAKSGIWIGVKKRYAQAILWKDGLIYDKPQVKVRGLEVVKSSTPSFCRKILKDMLHKLLIEDIDDKFIYSLNYEVMELYEKFKKEPIDNITFAVNVNNYNKYILDDSDPSGLKVAVGCPYNVRALAYYNWIINTKNLPDDNVYGGKIKVYIVKQQKTKKTTNIFIGYVAGSLPDWYNEYAPICYTSMWTRTFLEPINRIIESIGLPKLQIDGSIGFSLF